MKVNPKILGLGSAVVLSSLGLAFFMEGIFAAGFKLDLSLWMSFIPLVLLFPLLVSLASIFSITAPLRVRAAGYGLAAAAFGLVFMVPPTPISIPQPFPLLLSLIYLAGLGVLDYFSGYAVKIHAIFSPRIFAAAFSRFFLFFALAAGFLVYFSAQVPDPRLQIPEGVLDPALDLVLERVFDQLQSELGTGQFTQEEFLAELEKSGFANFLEEEYGITLEESELSSPEELVESIRAPLAVQLAQDVENFMQEYLGPLLPYLPLAAGIGAALSLLFLTPVFGLLTMGAFAGLYRILIRFKFARLEDETRSVPVLKID